MSAFIPYSSLTNALQARVWAVADALTMRDCLPLVRYMGNDAADFYRRIEAAVTERKVLVSDYWHLFQKVPFIAEFVLGGKS